jgi:hypothetical protein
MDFNQSITPLGATPSNHTILCHPDTVKLYVCRPFTTPRAPKSLKVCCQPPERNLFPYVAVLHPFFNLLVIKTSAFLQSTNSGQAITLKGHDSGNTSKKRKILQVQIYQVQKQRIQNSWLKAKTREGAAPCRSKMRLL